MHIGMHPFLVLLKYTLKHILDCNVLLITAKVKADIKAERKAAWLETAD